MQHEISSDSTKSQQFIDRINGEFPALLRLFEQGKIAQDCDDVRRALIGLKLHPDQLWFMVYRLGKGEAFFAAANDQTDEISDANTLLSQVIATQPEIIAKCQQLRKIVFHADHLLAGVMDQYATHETTPTEHAMRCTRAEIRQILTEYGGWVSSRPRRLSAGLRTAFTI
jgi:hypothetical protein